MTLKDVTLTSKIKNFSDPLPGRILPRNVDHLQQRRDHPNLDDHQRYSKHHFDSNIVHNGDLRQHLPEL